MNHKLEQGAITSLLVDWENGDKEALENLMALVYEELRYKARFLFAKEASGHTLQPAAIVNELYLRLVKRKQVRWENRAQFFAFAGQVMRNLLIDHARLKYSGKRGGRQDFLSLDEAFAVPGRQDISIETMVGLSEALARLEKIDARQAKVVEYRFFAGLSIKEIAQVLKISRSTVKRNWLAAKPWLARELGNR